MAARFFASFESGDVFSCNNVTKRRFFRDDPAHAPVGQDSEKQRNSSLEMCGHTLPAHGFAQADCKSKRTYLSHICIASDCRRALAFDFFHSIRTIFTAESVENHQKTRNITTKNVDNYVDGVDRGLNIHLIAENIYTSDFFSLCRLMHDEWSVIAKSAAA